MILFFAFRAGPCCCCCFLGNTQRVKIAALVEEEVKRSERVVDELRQLSYRAERTILEVESARSAEEVSWKRKTARGGGGGGALRALYKLSAHIEL